MHEAKALATGYFRDRHSVLAVAEGIGECIALASMPQDQRPKPISTGVAGSRQTSLMPRWRPCANGPASPISSRPPVCSAGEPSF